jgi:hypothetical protein
LPDPGQPCFFPCLLNQRKGHPVHPRRSLVRTGQRRGVAQDVFPVNLVIQELEARGRFRLRCAIELLLQAPDTDWCLQAHRPSPFLFCRTSMPCSPGPSLHGQYPASPVL